MAGDGRSKANGGGRVAERTRPVDAAGLVLIRAGRHGPEVLLGRRHRRVAFLPDIYVFPGGRVDPGDAAPSGFAEPIPPAVTAQLGGGGSRRPVAAYVRAALRETQEETGMLVGRPADFGPPADTLAEPWRRFAAQGLTPAFDAIDFVCRAITPAASHRRYNTRFFLADGVSAVGELGGSGELEDLRWFRLGDIGELGLVDVTQVVLAEALRRWRRRAGADAVWGRPAPLLCYRRDEVLLRRPGSATLVGEAAVLGAARLA